MASKRLFITGATGYIGGSVLEKIITEFPQLVITALLRSVSSEFRERYPNVEIVLGDFDAFDVIEKAASEADIVVHTGDIDHPGCAAAILSGVKKRKEPTFAIHLSGTRCISDEDEQSWKGDLNPHIWDDIRDIKELYDLPDSAAHHLIDKNFMDASNERLKTAIVCPPDIYGQKSGIGNRGTFLVPHYINFLLEKKEAFYLGSGENARAVTYIDDVVDLFILLIGEALKGGERAQWGKEGFYFAASGEVQWIKAAEAINKIGVDHGWLPKDSKPVSWTKEQVVALMPNSPAMYTYLFGSNSRANSARAKALGWNPHGPSFFEALKQDVDIAVAESSTK